MSMGSLYYMKIVITFQLPTTDNDEADANGWKKMRDREVNTKLKFLDVQDMY